MALLYSLEERVGCDTVINALSTPVREMQATVQPMLDQFDKECKSYKTGLGDCEPGTLEYRIIHDVSVWMGNMAERMTELLKENERIVAHLREVRDEKKPQ